MGLSDQTVQRDGSTPASEDRSVESAAATPAKSQTKLSKLLSSVGAVDSAPSSSSSSSVVTPSPVKRRTVTTVGKNQRREEKANEEGETDDVLKGVRFGEDALSAMQVRKQK